ncbi:MAG: hypothetical protein ACYDHV_08135, partial [Desulfurivibrionaceae bacterium]
LELLGLLRIFPAFDATDGEVFSFFAMTIISFHKIFGVLRCLSPQWSHINHCHGKKQDMVY